jgi:hypothetical protein
MIGVFSGIHPLFGYSLLAAQADTQYQELTIDLDRIVSGGTVVRKIARMCGTPINSDMHA